MRWPQKKVESLLCSEPNSSFSANVETQYMSVLILLLSINHHCSFRRSGEIWICRKCFCLSDKGLPVVSCQLEGQIWLPHEHVKTCSGCPTNNLVQEKIRNETFCDIVDRDQHLMQLQFTIIFESQFSHIKEPFFLHS